MPLGKDIGKNIKELRAGFRRNAHTKSAEAVESYRTVQRERHWRRQIVGKKGGKK